MKQTPQISHNQRVQRNAPLTDYNYQATVDAKSSCSTILPEKKLPAFYRLSSGFFGTEAYRAYVTDFLVFTVIGLITAWPIISMIVAVTRLLRNY
jgi:hypothetical protein